MRKTLPLLLLGCASLASPPPLAADPITLVSSSRSILMGATAGALDTGITTLLDQDVLSNSVGVVDPQCCSATASALLISSIETFSGRGATATSQDSTTLRAGAHSQASYFVTFDLTQTQRFEFDGAFTALSNDPNNRSAWRAELFYYPNGPNPLTAFNFTGNNSQILTVADLLGPGRYGFTVQAASDSATATGNGRAGLDYTFALNFFNPENTSPTPEPASMLLLGTGLFGILGARKFRTRRQKMRVNRLGNLRH